MIAAVPAIRKKIFTQIVEIKIIGFFSEANQQLKSVTIVTKQHFQITFFSLFKQKLFLTGKLRSVVMALQLKHIKLKFSAMVTRLNSQTSVHFEVLLKNLKPST